MSIKFKVFLLLGIPLLSMIIGQIWLVIQTQQLLQMNLKEYSDNLFIDSQNQSKVFMSAFTYEFNTIFQKYSESLQMLNKFQTKLFKGEVKMNPGYVAKVFNIERMYAHTESSEQLDLLKKSKYYISSWQIYFNIVFEVFQPQLLITTIINHCFYLNQYQFSKNRFQVNTTYLSDLGVISNKSIQTVSHSDPLWRAIMLENAAINNFNLTITITDMYVGFASDAIIYSSISITTFANYKPPPGCLYQGKYKLDLRCRPWFYQPFHQSDLTPIEPILFLSSSGPPFLATNICKRQSIQGGCPYAVGCLNLKLSNLNAFFKQQRFNTTQTIMIDPRTMKIVYNSINSLLNKITYLTDAINDIFPDNKEKQNMFQEAINEQINLIYPEKTIKYEEIDDTCGLNYSWIPQKSHINFEKYLNKQERIDKILLGPQNKVKEFIFDYGDGKEIFVTLKEIKIIEKNQLNSSNGNPNVEYIIQDLYLVIDILPRSILTEWTDKLQIQINKYFIYFSLGVIGIYIMIIFGIGVLSYRVGVMIEEPLIHMIKLLKQLESGGNIADLDLNNLVDGQIFYSRDATILFESFLSIFRMLQMVTQDIFNVEDSASLLNLTYQIYFFKKFNNHRVLGICYNNIGNIHFQNKRYAEAMENYLQSIIYAQYEQGIYKINYKDNIIPSFTQERQQNGIDIDKQQLDKIKQTQQNISDYNDFNSDLDEIAEIIFARKLNFSQAQFMFYQMEEEKNKEVYYACWECHKAVLYQLLSINNILKHNSQRRSVILHTSLSLCYLKMGEIKSAQIQQGYAIKSYQAALFQEKIKDIERSNQNENNQFLIDAEKTQQSIIEQEIQKQTQFIPKLGKGNAEMGQLNYKENKGISIDYFKNKKLAPNKGFLFSQVTPQSTDYKETIQSPLSPMKLSLSKQIQPILHQNSRSKVRSIISNNQINALGDDFSCLNDNYLGDSKMIKQQVLFEVPRKQSLIDFKNQNNYTQPLKLDQKLSGSDQTKILEKNFYQQLRKVKSCDLLRERYRNTTTNIKISNQSKNRKIRCKSFIEIINQETFDISFIQQKECKDLQEHLLNRKQGVYPVNQKNFANQLYQMKLQSLQNAKRPKSSSMKPKLNSIGQSTFSPNQKQLDSPLKYGTIKKKVQISNCNHNKKHFRDKQQEIILNIKCNSKQILDNDNDSEQEVQDSVRFSPNKLSCVQSQIQNKQRLRKVTMNIANDDKKELLHYGMPNDILMYYVGLQEARILLAERKFANAAILLTQILEKSKCYLPHFRVLCLRMLEDIFQQTQSSQQEVHKLSNRFDDTICFKAITIIAVNTTFMDAARTCQHLLSEVLTKDEDVYSLTLFSNHQLLQIMPLISMKQVRSSLHFVDQFLDMLAGDSQKIEIFPFSSNQKLNQSPNSHQNKLNSQHILDTSNNIIQLKQQPDILNQHSKLISTQKNNNYISSPNEFPASQSRTLEQHYISSISECNVTNDLNSKFILQQKPVQIDFSDSSSFNKISNTSYVELTEASDKQANILKLSSMPVRNNPFFAKDQQKKINIIPPTLLAEIEDIRSARPSTVITNFVQNNLLNYVNKSQLITSPSLHTIEQIDLNYQPDIEQKEIHTQIIDEQNQSHYPLIDIEQKAICTQIIKEQNQNNYPLLQKQYGISNQDHKIFGQPTQNKILFQKMSKKQISSKKKEQSISISFQPDKSKTNILKIQNSEKQQIISLNRLPFTNSDQFLHKNMKTIIGQASQVQTYHYQDSKEEDDTQTKPQSDIEKDNAESQLGDEQISMSLNEENINLILHLSVRKALLELFQCNIGFVELQKRLTQQKISNRSKKFIVFITDAVGIKESKVYQILIRFLFQTQTQLLILQLNSQESLEEHNIHQDIIIENKSVVKYFYTSEKLLQYMRNKREPMKNLGIPLMVEHF